MKKILDTIRKSDFDNSEGYVGWKSPSNIALVKYWGKYDRQIPANPSISFSLSNCFTETKVKFKPSLGHGVSMTFKFEGQVNETFSEKIEFFLNSLIDDFPMIGKFHFDIESKNSFPHSSGIASSASSMSALTLCLHSVFNKVAGNPLGQEDFFKSASYFARLGSGSASRSVYGNFAVWGQSDHFFGSDDRYAIETGKTFNSVFKNLHDDILIVEQGVKSVSSTAGHSLMKNHTYAENRFKQAKENMGIIKGILESGDFEKFGEIIEREALTLHSMMLSSSPSFILFKPNTLSILERIREHRSQTKLPIFFTLDAGANVHLIYPDNIKSEVKSFVESQLLVYCENGRYICDNIGKGPEQLLI